MTKWIYESPDGGKTVYAREFGKPSTRIHGHLPGSVADKSKTLKNRIDEQWYREQYPELDDLWRQYQTLLSLLAHGPDDDSM